MRFIHLSDLHLGKKLNEASLIEDQRHILTQIAEITQREKPDAVHDKPVPSAEAVGLLDDFLTLLVRRGLPVILISGNHDSAERLAFGARLFTAQGMHISPAFDAAHTIVAPIHFTDAHGTVNVWPVPFIKPAHVRAALPDAPAATYTEALGSVIAAMPIHPEERNVLVCHQFVTGALRSESEEVPVGGLDNVDAAVFAPFDYVALGHLHRPQQVKRDTVRYCGSPLKYSFAEAEDTKSVTLVELESKGNVRVRTVPLTPMRELRELRGVYGGLTLRDNYANTAFADYLHITLTDEDDIPDALSKLRVIYPNLLKLDYDNARTRNTQQLDTPDAATRRSPMGLLSDFFALQNNQPLNDQQRSYAQAAMEKIWEGRA
jgi:exonuclease SbcD